MLLGWYSRPSAMCVILYTGPTDRGATAVCFLLLGCNFLVPATVLVTGYGGFLGSAICRELLGHGYLVKGLARNSYPALAKLGVDCIQATATDPNACELACRGVNAVIHTAALAGVWGPAHLYEEANVTATENLLQACRRRGIGAFVFTSSPSVTFDGTAQRYIDESAPYPTRWLCHYPRTKAIAEQKVLNANDPSTFATCSLRPHLIWGSGDPHLVPRVVERCRTGKLRRVGNGRNLIDTVHVEYAAQAHRLAMERMLGRDTRASGRAFFLSDDEPVECWQWIRSILEKNGLVPPTRSISFRAAYGLGSLLEWVYGVARLQKEPPMTRFVASQLGVDHFFDISAAKEILSYRPIENRYERLGELAL